MIDTLKSLGFEISKDRDVHNNTIDNIIVVSKENLFRIVKEEFVYSHGTDRSIIDMTDNEVVAFIIEEEEAYIGMADEYKWL